MPFLHASVPVGTRPPGHELLPRAERRRWWGKGPSRRQGRFINALTLLAALLGGASFAMRLTADPGATQAPPPARPSVARTVGAALTDPRASTTAYIDDAALRFLDPLRGESGKMQAVLSTPGTVLGDAEDPHLSLRSEGDGQAVESEDLRAPQDPGIYKLRVQIGKATRAVEGLQIISMVPFSAKKNERVGLYYLGSWPYESGGQPRSAAYGNPKGFVEVTRENRNTPVSEHFKLGDFLTKDQANVWPKYVVIEPKLIDKMELVVEELKRSGVPVKHMSVMSGFRTPRYNKSGGNTDGRASLSRHMYGDAADIFVDNDRNGTMDDINKDGRVDTRDAEVIAAAAERVEKRHPALLGGIGIYKACCGHGPFTHVDTRGFRARWRL